MATNLMESHVIPEEYIDVINRSMKPDVKTKAPPGSIRMDCCHTCKIIFNKTIDYLRHKYKHHRISNFMKKSRYRKCPNCRRTFITRTALKNHSRVCRFRPKYRYECSGCSKAFTNYNFLKQHERQCFVPELIVQKRVRNIYVCDLCEKKFSNKSLLVHHKLKRCILRNQ